MEIQRSKFEGVERVVFISDKFSNGGKLFSKSCNRLIRTCTQTSDVFTTS